MAVAKPKLRVGDLVLHEGKRYLVSGTKGWIHKGGAISLRQTWSGLELLTRVSRCKLLTKRENIKKFWEILEEDK